TIGHLVGGHGYPSKHLPAMRQGRQPLRRVLLRQIQQNGMAIPYRHALILDGGHLLPGAHAFELIGLVLARQNVDELTLIRQVDQREKKANLVAVARTRVIVERNHGSIADNRRPREQASQKTMPAILGALARTGLSASAPGLPGSDSGAPCEPKVSTNC